MAFAHGSNDVANAVGPLAAIVGVLQTGEVNASSLVPSWVLLIGGVGYCYRPGDLRLPRDCDHRAGTSPS